MGPGHRVAAALALASATAGPASARTSLVESEAASLTLGGYVTTLGGVLSPPELGPLALPSDVGLSMSVLRLEWRLGLGEWATLDVHDRFAQVVMSDDVGAVGLGLGVTPAPERTVELESHLVDRPTHQLTHDLDRLSLELYLGAVDLTLGRQAISWGSSQLFSTVDLFSAFSPFDLDTSQRRGVDGVRALLSPAENVELDVLVVDRGALEDLSGGARATWYGATGDLWAAMGYAWERPFAAAGLSHELDTVKLRGEAFGTPEAAPRVSAGMDWFQSEGMLAVELHMNGDGRAGSTTTQHFLKPSDAMLHGETFLVGRWYAGALGVWTPNPELSLSASVLSNLVDPSALAILGFMYAPSSDASLTIGGFLPLGAEPDGLEIKSEMGTWARMAYVRLDLYL